MPTETAPARRALGRMLRIDVTEPDGSGSLVRFAPPAAAVAVLAVGFLGLGAAGLEPGDVEARLGLAAGSPIGPLGQVFGGWDAALAPGQVWIGQAWAWISGGPAGAGSIRGPQALAALAIGLILGSRLARLLGPRAGIFATMALWGSLGLIDRSLNLGADVLSGLAVVGALDRLLDRRSDRVAGLWASAALLLGGWPAPAMILVPAVILGRSGGSLSAGLVIPPLLTFAAWSCWACSAAGVEVWAAAVTWPLMRPSSWTLALWVAAAGLPWSPLALMAAWPAMRDRLGAGARPYALGWLQAAGVIIVLGTAIPGLGGPALVPAMAGLAVVAACCLDRAWGGLAEAGPRRATAGLALAVGLAWAAMAIYEGAYLAAAQPYYRGVAFAMLILGLVAGLMGLDAAWTGSTRGAWRTLLVVAVGIKLAHFGVYQVERNYRFGKGPWGRAVGQYVPDGWPIYTFHGISPALALATEHPVKQLRGPFYLKGQPGDYAKFVLLTGSEFDAWPEDVLPVTKVRVFQDEYGGARVLARTAGKIHRRVEE